MALVKTIRAFFCNFLQRPLTARHLGNLISFGLPLAIVLPVQSAHAFRPFFELGAGTAKILNPSPGLDTSSSLSYGMSYVGGFGFELTPPQKAFQVNIAGQVRTSHGTSADVTYYGLQSVYPQLRFEYKYLYFCLGMTPYIRTRSGTTSSFTAFNRATGALGYFAEAGYKVMVTPKVFFYATAAGEVIKTGTQYGPKPALEIVGFLRFYLFGPSTLVKESTAYGENMSDDDYEGWRYPWGRGR